MPSIGLAAGVAGRIAPCRTGRCALARWGMKRCRGSWTHHLPEGRRWHPGVTCRVADPRTASTPLVSPSHPWPDRGPVIRRWSQRAATCRSWFVT